MKPSRQKTFHADEPFIIFFLLDDIKMDKQQLFPKVNYHVYKLEGEEDLFTCVLDYSNSNAATVFQIGLTEIFYKPLYYSDGDLTDVNLYYVKSQKLKEGSNTGKVIKFNPGNSEWYPVRGEIKETHGWISISRVLETTSREIHEILQLEERTNSKI